MFSFLNRGNSFISVERLGIALVIAVQAIFYFYLLIRFPLHYDELMSYYMYTSNSFETIMVSYSSTNNHIFYNLVAHFFVLFPFNDEVAIRLPAYLSSLLGSFYFFKLCKRSLNPSVSLLLTVVLTSAYLFIMYSYEARGYAFVNLFCVLLFYSTDHLSQNYFQRKYRLLYVTALWLGLWSMPSFLYVLAPVCLVLVFYTWKQGREAIFRFCWDCLIAVFLVLSVYLPVFYLNDFAAIVNAQGDDKLSFQDPHYLSALFMYVHRLCLYLFSYDNLYLCALVIVLGPILYKINKLRIPYLLWLSVFTFISPVIFMVVHGVIPYQRVWVYVLIPSALCLGFLIQAILNLSKKELILFQKPFKILLIIFALVLQVYLLRGYPAKHRAGTSWDYEMMTLRNTKLKERMFTVHTIAHTTKGFEFYPASILFFYSKTADPTRNINLNVLDSIHGQDLLLIDSTEVIKHQPFLKEYDLIYKKDGILFFRRD